MVSMSRCNLSEKRGSLFLKAVCSLSLLVSGVLSEGVLSVFMMGESFKKITVTDRETPSRSRQLRVASEGELC